MDIWSAVLIIVVVGLTLGGAWWLDRRESGVTQVPPAKTPAGFTSADRLPDELTDTRKDGRRVRGRPQSWVSGRRLRRWFRRRWCEARHQGEPWKRMTEGPNHSTWYCRRCGRTWTFTRD